MIPRGLAVAVCVGVVAGAAAGAALYGKGAAVPGEPLSYVDGPSLSVDAERADYRTGEAVRIRVVNTGTVPLEFADGSYYGVRITQLDGIEVYSPPGGSGSAAHSATAGPAVLGPRDEAALVWNQTKNDGSPVLHGTYRIASSAVAAAAAAGGGGGGGGGGGEAVRLDASVAINILK